jgi:small subunit ribosomal protein S7
MARRNRADKREIHPDPVYNSLEVSKFINYLMLDGKRSKAEKSVYNLLERLAKETKQEALVVFNDVIDKVKPNLKVRSRRVGGATYQIPMEVRPKEAQALSMKWIISFARKRSGKTIADRLLAEFKDVLNGTGSSLKKRADTHKMAEANKAFAHFKW